MQLVFLLKRILAKVFNFSNLKGLFRLGNPAVKALVYNESRCIY